MSGEPANSTAALEAAARDIGEMIATAVGERAGFALLVFDFGDRGGLAYASNAERDGIVGVLVEWLEKQVAHIGATWSDKDRVALAMRLRQLGAEVGWPIFPRSAK